VEQHQADHCEKLVAAVCGSAAASVWREYKFYAMAEAQDVAPKSENFFPADHEKSRSEGV